MSASASSKSPAAKSREKSSRRRTVDGSGMERYILPAMRTVIGILAVLALGIWAFGSPDSTVPWVRGNDATHPASAFSTSPRVSTPPRVVGRSANPTAAAFATVAAPTPVANIPPPLPTPAELPPTLELVSLPTLSGSAPPRPISRADAVASVIRSREFQETVTPLARLYLATFGRYPDYEGLNHYTGQREEARPLHEIAGEFTSSREFEQRYGTLDNAQFVELLFVNVIGNASQADVRGYWVEALESGRMTRGEVLVDLAESGAFRERTAPEVFVSTAYTEILRRTPDPAVYAYWVSQLRSGHPYRSVINGLLAGP